MNRFESMPAQNQVKPTVLRAALTAPLVVALAFMGSTAPARADLTITANFDSSITSLANAGAIEAAINAGIANITSSISSPNSITVAIDFQNMNSGLGQSSTSAYLVSYTSYYNALKAVSTSPTQLAAFATLGANSTGQNPVNGSTQVQITSAEGRNLGLGTAGNVTDAGAPGKIFDSVVALNFAVAASDNYSIQAVATHEIDEVLGIGGPGSTLGNGNPTGPIGDLDLYRYANVNGVIGRSYSTSAASSYFSIDGGTTPLSYFNQEAGADYADWASDPIPPGYVPQVQDAFGTPGSSPTLGNNELTAFTVIGYGLVPNGAVPEPTSILMVAIGLGLTGWKFRPGKSAKTPASV